MTTSQNETNGNDYPVEQYLGWDGDKWLSVKRLDWDADGHTVFWFPENGYPDKFYQVWKKYPIRRVSGKK